MKIAKYIGELIYDYECVVIPGLGGFISTEKSATVDPLTNQFKPPFKDVHFNIHLKANDGLLVNYVARNEGISFKNAKQRVDKFVLICHKALKGGKRINFSKIGYIYSDKQQNIVFKQDKTINYNADAYGLSSFVSPAIRRPSSEEKIKEVFTKRATEGSRSVKLRKTSSQKKDRRVAAEGNASTAMTSRKRRPSKVKQQLLFIFIILFAFGSYYVINRRHAMLYYLDRYKVVIPFMYSNPNDYLVANAGTLPLDKISVSQASWLSGVLDLDKKSIKSKEESNTPVVEKTLELDDNVFDQSINENKNAEAVDLKVNEDEITDESKDFNVEVDDYSITPITPDPEPKIEDKTVKKKVAVIKSNSQNKYFIIAGSFKSRTNAQNLVSTLISQGYDALIADTNSYGMYRVALMGFSGGAEAENRLVAIKRDFNSEAWILKK